MLALIFKILHKLSLIKSQGRKRQTGRSPVWTAGGLGSTWPLTLQQDPLPLVHGLVENKTILKSVCHNNVGEDNKSPQSILVISRSFKALHNFVKTGNLGISSFLNEDWESSEFCMPWFYYGFLLTLLWRDKKDVARKKLLQRLLS